MRRLIIAIALLIGAGHFRCASAQSTYATVSGTVADPSGAVLPGVSITATNNSDRKSVV